MTTQRCHRLTVTQTAPAARRLWMSGLVQIQPDTNDLTGQMPGRGVAWFIEPDCLAFSAGGKSVAFATGSAPGLPLLVKVFDFAPEGAGADLGDREGAVVGAVQAGGGPDAVGDGEVLQLRSVLAGGDTG